MDEATFTRVYKEHVDFVWRLSRSLGVDPMHLDDVVHEVFLVVRRRFDARYDGVPLTAWLARITRNVVLHHRRALVREARRRHPIAAPIVPRGPDEQLDLAEAAELMQTFLDGLEPARREVFVLMEIEGLSAPEVADVTGAKLPTVYTRLRAARLELAAFTERLRRGSDATAGPGGPRARR